MTVIGVERAATSVLSIVVPFERGITLSISAWLVAVRGDTNATSADVALRLVSATLLMSLLAPATSEGSLISVRNASAGRLVGVTR